MGEEGGRKRVHFKSVFTYVPCDGAINIRHYDLVSVVPEIQCTLCLSGTLHRLPEWNGEHKDKMKMLGEILGHDWC